MIWLVSLAHAGITLAPSALRVGEDVVITTTNEFGEPRSGETARVIFAPDLAAARERAIGITDGRGRIRWTPDEPGVHELRIGDEALRVRAAPDPTDGPTARLLVMLVGLAATVALYVGLVPPSRRLAFVRRTLAR